MSKKKGDVPPKSVLLGRVGTNLKCGIVGLPNVGRVPAYLNVVDIAGLVKGAHEGAGLGNAFLSHIKSTDAIIHVLRVFSDPDVSHVEGDINPVRDLAIIEEELRLKDEEYVNVQWEKLEKAVIRGGDKKQKPDLDCMTKAKELICEKKTGIRFGEWSPTEIEVLNHHQFLTAKPVIYLVNMSEKDYFRKKNKWLAPIKEWVDAHDPGATIIPFSADFELRFIEMSPEEQEAFHKEMPGVSSVLPKIIQTSYKTLQLIYFFTCGKDEVKAWTIQKNTKAPQAAGRIHSDMEKGFIMAEVMSFEDFKTEGSEVACRNAGKYRQKGREYVVQDGDIIFFKFNAGAGLAGKKK